MRTFILSLLALLMWSMTVSAQIGKGRFISETSLNFSTENLGTILPESNSAIVFIRTLPGNKKNRIFDMQQSIGYSISDRLVIGIGLGYTHLRNIQTPALGFAISVNHFEYENNINNYTVEEYYLDEKAISIRPNLYVSYFIPLSKRLQLVSRFDIQQERTAYTVYAENYYN